MDPETLEAYHVLYPSVYPNLDRTRLQSLTDITSDAYIGYWVLVITIIVAGVIYGIQLNKDYKNFGFPKIVSIMIFPFYVGMLMYTPAGIVQFAMFGVYAYFMYALATFVGGLALIGVATLAWMLFFRVGAIVWRNFPILWNTSEAGLSKFLQR